MAIAMIKNPPDTILDRSIVISLRRKLPNESAEKLNIKLFEALKPLRQKIKKWADDNTEQLKTSRPQIPNINNDRAADNWFPLFAVAGTLGDKWFRNAELALQQLNISDIAEESIAAMLLADVKHIFEIQGTDKIHSDDLVKSLNELEERPWNEWKNGKPLTKNSLAKLLKPFGVKPKQLRIDKDNKNGYHLLNLKDTFARYLPNTPVQSSAPLQPSVDKGCKHLQNSTEKLSVEFCKPPEANTVAACRGVEVQKGVINDQI
jgi:putative DNA primase/helicase